MPPKTSPAKAALLLSENDLTIYRHLLGGSGIKGEGHGCVLNYWDEYVYDVGHKQFTIDGRTCRPLTIKVRSISR